jgi:hypothetical protein
MSNIHLNHNDGQWCFALANTQCNDHSYISATIVKRHKNVAIMRKAILS